MSNALNTIQALVEALNDTEGGAAALLVTGERDVMVAQIRDMKNLSMPLFDLMGDKQLIARGRNYAAAIEALAKIITDSEVALNAQ